MTTINRRRKWWQRSALCKYYARLVAVGLIFLGVASSEHTLGWSWLPTAFHLILAALFAYAGFFVRDKETVQDFLEGFGWLLAVVKGISALTLWALGEVVLWNPIEWTCVLIGVSSILVGRYLRDPLPTREHE